MNQLIFYNPSHESQSHQKLINYVFECIPNNIEFVFYYGQDDKPRFHLNLMREYFPFEQVECICRSATIAIK